jgi:hypothetical protein
MCTVHCLHMRCLGSHLVACLLLAWSTHVPRIPEPAIHRHMSAGLESTLTQPCLLCSAQHATVLATRLHWLPLGSLGMQWSLPAACLLAVQYACYVPGRADCAGADDVRQAPGAVSCAGRQGTGVVACDGESNTSRSSVVAYRVVQSLPPPLPRHIGGWSAAWVAGCSRWAGMAPPQAVRLLQGRFWWPRGYSQWQEASRGGEAPAGSAAPSGRLLLVSRLGLLLSPAWRCRCPATPGTG